MPAPFFCKERREDKKAARLFWAGGSGRLRQSGYSDNQ